MTRLLLLLSLPAFAQTIPPRSFFDLAASNGHGAVMVDTRTGRLTHFREHLPATEEPELDAQGNERWVGNQPQMVKSRDLLFDAYFGLRVGTAQRWLDGTPVSTSGYATAAPSPRGGSGIVTLQQQALGLELTTSVFAPRSFPHAAYVAVLCARNAGATALANVSLFHLINLHLGFGRPGVMTDLASNGETVVINPAGDLFERGFAGVVGTRPLGTAIATAWNPTTPPAQNGFLIVRDTPGDLLARTGDLGVASDWAGALQFNLGTLQPNAEQCVGVITAHHGDPLAQALVTGWLDIWLAGRTAREVLDAELAGWATLQAALHVPPALTDDEASLTRQSAAVLLMAQVQERDAFLREFLTQDGEARSTRFRALDGGTSLPATIRHRGQGALLASLPPGEWTYAWVRDGAFAAVALAELGLTAQSRAALSFFLDAEAGRFKDWNEFQPTGFPDYGVSLTRYVGFGVEETDFNAFGPNLEFDGFGLVLWALREHERRTGDTTLVDARWSDISTRIADPLLALIEPSTGLLRKDSSIWETHWNGRERTWTYSNLTAARGLCDAAELAQRQGDTTRAASYRTAGLALRRTISEKLTDGRGALASNREELLSGAGYFDAAVLEGIALGLFAPDGRVAQATLDAMDRQLHVPFGPGWARNDDRVDHGGASDLSPWGSEYDSAEWIYTDLRGAVAMRAAGRSTRAEALINFTSAQSAANGLVLAETYEETTGAWKFNAPMVGFGAGAWVLAMAHRGGLAVTPACGAFDEVAPVDAGVPDAGSPFDAGVSVPDAGTADAGTTATRPPQGCGCTSTPTVLSLALLLWLSRRRMRLGVACLGLCLSWSCSAPSVVLDAGVMVDAGHLPDAGLGVDAGVPDAGVVDAGPGLVAGQAWGNLQHPPFFTSAPGASTAVYGQLWIDGRTSLAGVTPGVSAELGFGPTGTDPATDARWSWTAATFNLDVGNNDEFVAQLVAPASGVFDYAFRYRLEAGGRWTVADRSGTDDGYQLENAGRLAVRVSGGTLRFATQNLHCLDASPAARLELAATRYAQLQLDAVTLQEICVDATLGNTAEVLAARLRVLTGRPWRHFFLETHLANGTTSEGVGLITALPVGKTATLTLPTVSFGRAALQVIAASEVGMVSLSTEHFSFESTAAGAQDRLDQVNAVVAFEQAAAPLVAAQVVAGDLNSGPTEAPATQLVNAGFVDAWAASGSSNPGFTYPTPTPTERIDYVFVKGLLPTQTQLEFTGPVVSDHLGVSTQLVVP